MTHLRYPQVAARGQISTLAGLASLLALAVWSPKSASAQPLSRGTVIARAMTQNPQVAAARAAEAEARARQGQAEAARWPAVSVVLGAGPSLTAERRPGTVDSVKSTYDVTWSDLSVSFGGRLDVIQPLYTFGKIGQRHEAAGHELNARRAQTEMTQVELAVTSAQLYEGYLYARDAERFFDETEHWLERTLEATRAEIEAGADTSEKDVLRLEAAIGAIRLGLHQAQANRRQAAAGLGAYLNWPPNAPFEVSEPTLEMLPTPPDSAESLVSMALQQRPELRALNEGAAAYKALAAAEQAGHLPDFFVMAFAFGGITPGRDFVTSRYVQDQLNGFYPGMLVGARWQIQGGMASRRADENRALAEQLAHARRWALAALPAQVTKAFEDVQRAHKDEQTAASAMSTTKRWLVTASADRSVGLGDSREVTDAAQAYVQLRMAHFDAKYRHNVALAELARATGTLGHPSSPYYPNRPRKQQTPRGGDPAAPQSSLAQPGSQTQVEPTNSPADASSAGAAADNLTTAE